MTLPPLTFPYIIAENNGKVNKLREYFLYSVIKIMENIYQNSAFPARFHIKNHILQKTALSLHKMKELLFFVVLI